MVGWYFKQRRFFKFFILPYLFLNFFLIAERCGQKQTCFFSTKLKNQISTNLCLVNRVFFCVCIFKTFLLEIVHTEAILKGLNKSDLIKIVLQLESEMNSDMKELTLEIRDLVTQIRNLCLIEDWILLLRLTMLITQIIYYLLNYYLGALICARFPITTKNLYVVG